MSFFIGAFLAAGAVLAAPRAKVSPPVLDARGEPELIVCNQNLENWGLIGDIRVRKPTVTEEEIAAKEAALVQRFVRAQCDVIAAQEILGKSMERTQLALERLGTALTKKTGRRFSAHAAASNDQFLHNGFLVATDRAEVLNLTSYRKVELPKLVKKQRARYFTRGPFEIQLSVRPRGSEAAPKTVTLVGFHFKSKGGTNQDPAGLQWETYRMEMAEGLRRVVENRHARSFGSGDTILVLLGDRNSNFDEASARILEGTLTLQEFQNANPACRLSKRGVPLCRGQTVRPQRLFSVLTGDPQTKNQPGTHRFRNEYSWLDEILLPHESLRHAWERYDSEGDFASGVVYEGGKTASDHALVWVKLNW